MFDPVKMEIEASGMTHEQFKKLPVKPWQHWLAAILLGLLAAFLGGPSAHALFVLEVRGVAVYAGLAVALGCFALGTLVCWARDYRESRFVMIMQVLIAVAAGVVGFFSATDSIARWVVVLAAAVTVANGLDKLRKTL